MNRKLAGPIAILLIALIALSLFIFLSRSSNQSQSRQFYVGVEYAYGNNQTAQTHIAQVQALVDKVKNYTNLFIIGTVELTFDRAALNQACDYIYDNKLDFIVLFTGLDQYSYNISDWMLEAKQRYSERFLGIYRYDEPGGRTLEQGIDPIVKKIDVPAGATYRDVSNLYVGNLTAYPNYYLQFSPRVVTADFGLYWFDYKAQYSAIFAEFVGNESRQRHIALCRGAADAFGRDWGVIVNWKYNQAPYLESGDELYEDLSLAYSAGAKYTVVFSYPNITAYGTLTQDHFDSLQRFWNTLQTNPASFGSNKARVAYVVPADYGFGFRSPDDTIWGVFAPDALSPKIYSDVQALTDKYGAQLDILYNEPQTIALILGRFSEVYYWNQTVNVYR